jgi:hypothetical protein
LEKIASTAFSRAGDFSAREKAGRKKISTKNFFTKKKVFYYSVDTGG